MKVHLWDTPFVLPAMNGPLPAGLKFRENTAKSSNYVTYSNVTLTRLEGATIITLFVIGCPKRKKSITLNILFYLKVVVCRSLILIKH